MKRETMLEKLEKKGFFLAESRFFQGVTYAVDGAGLTILAGRCGKLQINWDRIDEFTEELLDFKDMYSNSDSGSNFNAGERKD